MSEDLSMTITPKSDQLNADDLIVGPKTITVIGVKLTDDKQQPTSIYFEGDNGRPFKPCLTMRRLLIAIWGKYKEDYIGKSMTLFRDTSVHFGPDAVGGIRISHMSHINEPTTVMLTVTRAKRKPYTVQPLKAKPVDDVRQKGIDAANGGTETLRSYWESLTIAQKKQLKDDLEIWKQIAARADEGGEQ